MVFSSKTEGKNRKIVGSDQMNAVELSSFELNFQKGYQ